jgi:hypothetical protein
MIALLGRPSLMLAGTATLTMLRVRGRASLAAALALSRLPGLATASAHRMLGAGCASALPFARLRLRQRDRRQKRNRRHSILESCFHHLLQMSCFVQLKENPVVPDAPWADIPDPKAAGLSIRIYWLLCSAYRDAGAEHDEATQHDLENRLQKRGIHIARADPGDGPEFD